MQKINSIFLDLLELRKNSAISFDDAGENEAYSAKIYWEYLNNLSDAINDQLKAFKFTTRLVIKDNIVQIEVYLPDCSPPEYTPYAVFQFGHEIDIPHNIKDHYNKSGCFYYNETFQQSHVIDAEQIHAVFDNLKKHLEYGDGNYETESKLPILQEANSYWKQIISKQR